MSEFSPRTIKQLTRVLGVSARTLRHYEDVGLVSPTRRGPTRVYSEEDCARLLVVLRGRRLGFRLEEMSEMLRSYDLKDSEIPEERLVAKTKFLARLHRLERKRKDVEESIDQISACLAEIDGAAESRPWHTFFVPRVSGIWKDHDSRGNGKALTTFGHGSMTSP